MTITSDNYMDHPIRKMAESRGRVKLIRKNGQDELPGMLAATFTQEELSDWVKVARADAHAWHKRNMERYAGSDLLDANRGVYSLTELANLVNEAILVGA